MRSVVHLGPLLLLIVLACTPADTGTSTDTADTSTTDTDDTDMEDTGDTSEGDLDLDEDGFTPLQGDCDDADPDRYPTATDTVGDDIDQNCDGVDGVDSDGDGVASEASGGTDCDDEEPTTYPGAEDTPCDGVFSDCDHEPVEAHVPTGFSTIQSAVNSDPDYVCVAAGTYAENLTLTSVAEIYGAGPDSTTINGGGTGSTVAISDEDTDSYVLARLKITGGSAPDGGGLYVENATLSLNDVSISNNSCDAYQCKGVGAFFTSATVSLTSADFSDNTCAVGTYFHGTGFYANGSSVSGESVDLSGNSCGVTNSCDGIGAKAVGGTLSLTSSTVDQNIGDVPGGITGVGLNVINAASLELTDVVFDQNSATSDGSSIGVAIFATDVLDVVMSDVTLSQNSLFTTASGHGAGAYFVRSPLDLTDVTVTGNTILADSVASGAGMYVNQSETIADNLTVIGNTAVGASSTGAGTMWSDHADIQNSTFSGNSCEATTYCYGPGFYVSTAADISLTNVDISDNEIESEGSADGGGLYSNLAELTLNDVRFERNIAAAGVLAAEDESCNGGGLYISRGSLMSTDLQLNANACVASDRAYGGGMATSNTPILAERTSAIGNVAWGENNSYGGGVSIFRNTVDLEYAVLLDNIAKADNYNGNGGGIYICGTDGVVLLTQADVVANSVIGPTGALGGGIFNSADLSLHNTSIVGNSVDEPGSSPPFEGHAISQSGLDLNISYCNLHGHDTEAYFGLENPVGSDGNIDVDPEYTDITDTDVLKWDLTPTNADVIDAGDPGDTDADLTRSDIGSHGGISGNWGLP